MFGKGRLPFALRDDAPADHATREDGVRRPKRLHGGQEAIGLGLQRQFVDFEASVAAAHRSCEGLGDPCGARNWGDADESDLGVVRRGVDVDGGRRGGGRRRWFGVARGLCGLAQKIRQLSSNREEYTKSDTK